MLLVFGILKSGVTDDKQFPYPQTRIDACSNVRRRINGLAMGTLQFWGLETSDEYPTKKQSSL